MREHYGVELNSGPWGINSRRALVGAKVAEAQGEAIGEAYHRGVLHAYWLEGRSIDDLDVLKDIAGAAGMDAEAFALALDDPQYNQAVSVDVALAYRLGIQGVPALIFDRQYYVSGWQPSNVLRDLVDQITAQQSGEHRD